MPAQPSMPNRADAVGTASDFELACDFEALAVETDDGERGMRVYESLFVELRGDQMEK
jgi:hypothetical protein